MYVVEVRIDGGPKEREGRGGVSAALSTPLAFRPPPPFPCTVCAVAEGWRRRSASLFFSQIGGGDNSMRKFADKEERQKGGGDMGEKGMSRRLSSFSLLSSSFAGKTLVNH